MPPFQFPSREQVLAPLSLGGHQLQLHRAAGVEEAGIAPATCVGLVLLCTSLALAPDASGDRRLLAGRLAFWAAALAVIEIVALEMFGSYAIDQMLAPRFEPWFYRQSSAPRSAGMSVARPGSRPVPAASLWARWCQGRLPAALSAHW